MKIKISVLFAILLTMSIGVMAQFKLYERGHDSYKAGKYEEAVRSLSEYLTRGTRDKALDIEVFYIRALSYYKSNQFQKAIPDFEETILLNHKNKGNIYWFLAKCHLSLSQKDDALESYNSALRELSSDSEAKSKILFERSQIYTGLGQVLMAYEDIRHAKTLAPSNREIIVEADKLEKNPQVIEKYQLKATQEQVAHAAGTTDKKSKQTPSAKKKSTGDSKVTGSDKKDSAPPPVTVANNTGTVAVPVTTASNTQPKNTTPVNTSTTVKTENREADKKASETAKSSSTPPATTVATVPAGPPSLAEQYKDEKRFALVIGNSSYGPKIGELRNPVNDATDVAAELKASRFDVVLLTNATYGQIRAALLKFKDKIDGGEKDKTVALFYYAGHGLAFEDENYLVPVDAEVEYQDDIPRYCFPIQRMVLSNMERSNSRMNIVILDACRNNPFPVATRSAGSGGLGEMRRARGSFIAYATSPGSVASDGTGRNGLYTQELLKSLKKPGLTIEQVFKDVRLNVLKLSNDKQNTWDSSNITGEFYFKF